MQELRRICDRHGILLVLDEVQSGVGRTGKWWAVEHTGVEPDMICIAKGIASGMPLGITMTRSEIMDWVPGSHASTFGGNPVCVAAALATLDVIEKEKLLEHSADVGAHMMKRMSGWPSKLKLVGDVRGRGLMIGVDIVKDKTTKEYGAAERDLHCREGIRTWRALPGLWSEHGPDMSAAGGHERRGGRCHRCAGGVHSAGRAVV